MLLLLLQLLLQCATAMLCLEDLLQLQQCPYITAHKSKGAIVPPTKDIAQQAIVTLRLL
jgi:hypothetical protein